MAYLDLDVTLTEQHLQLKAEVHKFAVEVLRPAALALDKLPPEKVIEKGSLYWQTMARMYENGYHTAALTGHPGSLAQDPVAHHPHRPQRLSCRNTVTQAPTCGLPPHAFSSELS